MQESKSSNKSEKEDSNRSSPGEKSSSKDSPEESKESAEAVGTKTERGAEMDVAKPLLTPVSSF